MADAQEIKRLQARLNAVLKPSPRLSVDGLMGPKTRVALARYHAVKAVVPHGAPPPLITAAAAPAPAAQPAANAADAWMTVAEAELGTGELAGSSHNRRIVEYHATTSLAAQSDETPWCSSFVNWVMRQAGKTGTNNALARSWLGWGVATTARYGAIVVIQKKTAGSDAATGSSTGFHVGFLVEKTSTRVRLLGGNQSDTVKLSNFGLAGYDVRGYRWPS
jgi:uncharacterized protein (TIGR02594 family)